MHLTSIIFSSAKKLKYFCVSPLSPIKSVLTAKEKACLRSQQNQSDRFHDKREGQEARKS